MTSTQRRTAVVTGASRGIGKATAIALADAGFDVAITARTVHEGDGGDGGEGLATSLPGSLDATAAEIAARGQRAVAIPLDLLDRAALVPAAIRAIEALGHVDVLVNNAIYVGPGNLTRFLDTPWEAVEDRLYANLTAQLAVTRPILADMVARGSGTIVMISSGAGRNQPPGPPGAGGWGLAYSASKAAVDRVAVHLAVEYGDVGIRAFAVDPGFVRTERVAASGPALAHIADRGADPARIGAALAHLVTHAEHFPNGAYLEAQRMDSTM